MPAVLPETRSSQRASVADRLEGALLWGALAVALSPVAVDLARHWAAEPWARYSVVFPVLLVAELVRRRTPAPASRWGYAWLGAALALEIVGVGGGVPRLARPALPFAVIGLLRLRGTAPLRTAALVFWMIPLPHLLLAATSPALEAALLRAAAAPLAAAGLGVSTEGVRAVTAGGSLVLAPAAGGLVLAALLSGLGWAFAIRRGDSPRGCVAWALVGAFVALPLAIFAIAVALVALRLGATGIGEGFLVQGLPLGVAAAALLGLLWPGSANEGTAAHAG